MPHSGRAHRDPLMARARKGRAYRELRATVFDPTHGDPDICITCGHAGTDQMGHRIPLTVRPDLGLVRSNVGRQHGTQPCPICGRRCNQSEGNGLVAGRHARVRPNKLRTSEQW